MLQRNTTAYPWTWAGDAPYTVLPGETTDHPELLDGWTPVVDEPEPEPDVEPARTSAKSKRTAAADTEGGEPR
ncbi:hypothetical protein [Streptacidiphilus sp. EB129]|uniref:hypothetical protein n=1 Tax=Streptacidiphilus sp. EB129 TaxID=3156262 RepID=UPI0035179441